MNEQQLKIKAWKIGCGIGGLLILFLFVLSIKELASISDVGDASPVNTISVTGTGDAYAIPDVATFTFTVSDTEKAVSDAQTKVTAEGNSALAVVRSAGVADKDIQTTSYSISPQYEYQNAVCPSPSIYEFERLIRISRKRRCDPFYRSRADFRGRTAAGKQTLTGYQVSESVSVKLRDLTKAGSLLAALGSAGVSDLNGPSFTVDNPDSVQASARSKAIADATSKAQELAKELGVSIVRVTSFSDDNNGYIQPVMYAMAASGSV